MPVSSELGRSFAVVDAHQHFGTVMDAGVGIAGGVDGHAVETRKQDEFAHRLEVLDRRGIDRAVMLAGHSYLRPNGLADTRRVNDDLAAYVASHPDRLTAGVGVVEPLYGEAGLAEIDRCHQLGLVGVTFHGRFQGVSHDSPWVLRYVQRLGELGMIPFMHAPSDSPEEALWKTEAIGKAFPDLTVMVLDAFMDFEQSREAVKVAERCPNLVFDTALSFDFEFIVPFVRACGSHRLAYGSDLYSWPAGTYGADGIRQIVESGLDEADIAAVLSGTINAVLGLMPDRAQSPPGIVR
jgi:predicted TIM-barrel fold metal-dependent hydrolase